jgi:ABC-type lipoprotein release transport system permease subunit
MVFLQIIILNVYASTQGASSDTSLRGVVLDEKGSPVGNASVTIWFNRQMVASGKTGSDGCFYIDVKSNALYTVFVFADDETTPGIDYLPSRIDARPSNGTNLVFNLSPAASLTLTGDVQFVESEQLPISFSYVVIDPSGQTMTIGGFQLKYGSSPDTQSLLLGLDPTHLIVPANVPFMIMGNFSLFASSALVHRTFVIDTAGHFMLGKGDEAAVDVRRYALSSNMGIIEDLYGKVESRMSEMESVGFYLDAERAKASSAERLLSESKYLLAQDRLVDSFDAAKRSFMELRQIMTGLTNSYGDAVFSVYILIFLLGFASVTIAFLMTNSDRSKIIWSFIVSAMAFSSLYMVYPGSTITPPILFVVSAVSALLLSLSTAILFPKILKGRGSEEHVPLRRLLVPIFSIAKRNLRRRRLRFVLTLSSITALVMSFVALTSFSEGYGLIVTVIPGSGASHDGVMVRSSGFTEANPAFLSMTDPGIAWLEKQSECRVLSPKAENAPFFQPLATLNRAPIFGVVGINSTIETSVVDLRGVLREGDLPTGGGVMISEELRRKLGVDVGDELYLDWMPVRLAGVFDDNAFRVLADLDGRDYVPKKLVNNSPQGEAPVYVLASCETSEVVVTDLSTAMSMPLVGISRVDVAVSEGFAADAFATRLALERGYLTWASSPEGISFAHLGSYLEGKGIPLVVPWVIVVLNVVVTMLNSMYERRREVHILSSVGLNPAHIAGIFVAESSIIGVVGGGVGYLVGLSLYRGMAMAQMGLEVHQKISALWSLAAIGVSMTAVFMGALLALKSSVVITPSLTRRWRIENDRGDFTEPWEISVPVKLSPSEVDGFIDFMVGALRDLEDNQIRRTSSIKVSRDAGGVATTIEFIYKSTQSIAENFYTRNAVLLERGTENVSVRLKSHGEQSWAHTTGSLVRQIAIRWSAAR